MSRFHACTGDGCGVCQRLIEQAEDERDFGYDEPPSWWP